MNVILIIIDALRAQNLGLYGAQPSPTPNIDKWAKKGVVFENAYTSITMTDASRTAILSGLYPLSSGLIHQAHKITPQQQKRLEKVSFLPEILKKKGYQTLAIDWIARWHQRGFDYYSGRFTSDQERRESWLVLTLKKILRYARTLDALSIRLLKRDFLIRFYYCFFKNPFICATADQIVKKAIQQIETHQHQKFYLQLHLWDVHYPHIRPTGLKSYLFDSLEDRYNAELSFVDQQLGKLFRYLDQKKQLQDTLVIITGDHGDSLTEHQIPWAHHGLYEEVVKVPLLIKHPQFPSQRIKSLTQNIDIAPTILDLVGIKSKNLDGISLLPQIQKKAGKGRSWVYFEDLDYGTETLKKPSRKRGLRQGDYKYIQTFKGPDKDIFCLYPLPKFLVKEEVYHLSKDPQELQDLASQKPKLTASLKKELEKIIRELKKKSQLKKPSPKLKKATPGQSSQEREKVMERLKDLGYL
jgi:arylsulfatase A-like enzyme